MNVCRLDPDRAELGNVTFPDWRVSAPVKIQSFFFDISFISFIYSILVTNADMSPI